MACRGVHFALTDDDLGSLLACADDDERLELLQVEIEERLFSDAPDRACETDKAWDAIHRALTDGTLDPDAGAYPAAAVILGGRSLYDSDDYIVSHKTARQVRAIAALLESVTSEEFLRGYERIDPEDYGGEIGDDDFEYKWDWFQGLKEFFKRAAAAAGHHVLFTVDQ